MSPKGAIPPHCEVEVRFIAAATNTEPAELNAGFGIYNPNGIAAGVNVRPGDTGSKVVQSRDDGTLWVHVNLDPGADAGELEVYVNGALHEASHVSGDRWRLFAVRSVNEEAPA